MNKQKYKAKIKRFIIGILSMIISVISIYAIKSFFSITESTVKLNKGFNRAERNYINIKKEILESIFNNWPQKNIFLEVKAKETEFKVTYNSEYADIVYFELFGNESDYHITNDSIMINDINNNLLVFQLVNKNSVVVPVRLITNFIEK